MRLYEQELIDRGRRRAEQYGFTLAPDAEALLRRLVRAGIERLGGEGEPIDNQEAERALAALDEFVQRMATNAASELREGGGAENRPVSVTEEDFEAAFAGLCPGFWPFC